MHTCALCLISNYLEAEMWAGPIEQFQIWTEGGTLALSLDCLNTMKGGDTFLSPLSNLVFESLWGWWVTLCPFPGIGHFISPENAKRSRSRLILSMFYPGQIEADHVAPQVYEEPSATNDYYMVQKALGTKWPPDFFCVIYVWPAALR